ncbi:MAG: putative membrane protein insertion efficiency factor [Hyphomicrobiaceae bacterium hypho_1]
MLTANLLFLKARIYFREVAKAPIYIYRWTLKPWFGWPCRHLPTCSDYALEAIDKNGVWKGGWLILSRLMRCHPWGTAGLDPVPDLTSKKYKLQPWRYGRWNDKHMVSCWSKNVDQDTK